MKMDNVDRLPALVFVNSQVAVCAMPGVLGQAARRVFFYILN